MRSSHAGMGKRLAPIRSAGKAAGGAVWRFEVACWGRTRVKQRRLRNRARDVRMAVQQSPWALASIDQIVHRDKGC